MRTNLGTLVIVVGGSAMEPTSLLSASNANRGFDALIPALSARRSAAMHSRHSLRIGWRSRTLPSDLNEQLELLVS